jgi:p-cumate 2,3-dioxygenase ferredoxin reductase component
MRSKDRAAFGWALMTTPNSTRGDERIVIVGAGQAGARTAEAMRGAGHVGVITLLGEEPHLPYERPQLSKDMLLRPNAQVAPIKTAEAWSSLGVELHLGAKAIQCDLADSRVALADGRAFAFDRLVIATGVRPRQLATQKQNTPPLLYLRTMEDAAAAKEAFAPGKHIVMIGGGVIGLETAAAANAAGCDVTVVEIGQTLLARALPGLAAAFLLRRHRRAGVDFVFGVGVERLESEAVILTSGKRLAADLVVVGIGAEPNFELAERMGLDARDGICVDAFGATQAPGVYAAGDVTAQWNPRCQSWSRIETWANAQNQAIALGKTLAGQPTAYADPVWFWTDQYEANVQIVGDMSCGDILARGDIESESFTLLNMDEGIVRGAVTINRRPDMAALRKLVARAKPMNASDLENPAFDLRKAVV